MADEWECSRWSMAIMLIRYTPMVLKLKSNQRPCSKVIFKTLVITLDIFVFKDNTNSCARKAKDAGDGGILSEKLVYVTPFDDK